MFERQQLHSASFSGTSLNMKEKLQYNTKPIEYMHWDDVNEIVDQLRLIIASKHEGNTSHDNRIHAILSELYEAGVIY